MKKFILPLMLLFFVGTMFAVESAPSDVVGYVKYECVINANGGNNLVALPMGTQFTMASDLGDAYPGVITTVTGWDAANQGWSAAFLSGGTWYDNFAVSPGMSYMLTVTENVDFYSIGDLNDPIAYDLVYNANGGNSLIMVPLDRSDLLEADDLGDDIGVVSTVTKWDNVSQGWSAAFKSGGTWYDNYSIAIAMPLMVTATEATTWGAPAAKAGITRQQIRSYK
ncbi:MAG: hypothetical protein LHW59_10920 [Candidatus Cloacimonetes bacterium]|nr:hypothetical protein [Candidatus Cloacimonadota bacterium]